MKKRPWRLHNGLIWCRTRVFPAFLALALFIPTLLRAQPTNDSSGTNNLRLNDFIKLVLERNESVQAKLLEIEVTRRKAKGEYGVFEPEAFASWTRESNKRQNTVEQQSASSGAPDFSERNNIYEGGLESLVPTGGKVRLGYTLRELRNSLQTNVAFLSRNATNGEYQTFVGLTFNQPLLKNAWYPANLAGIRIAALTSDIAFQDYRRQLMLVLSSAEASYWNLYSAQEQVRFFEESLATAEKILKDIRDRQGAGVSSELDVLEAQAGVALRRSKLSDAEEKLYEAADHVLSLYADTIVGKSRLVRAVDRPEIDATNYSYFTGWRDAFDDNPDYRIQRKKALQESVRLAVARNQALPELNLKGSYGLNGLGEAFGTSWDDINQGSWPSWSIGLELHVPLTGGIKGRNELAAARIREKESLVNLHEIETQIANALDTALHKINSARDSIQSYQSVVKFNQDLLNAAIARLQVGRLESRKVLEIEADLFEARNSVVDGLVAYQRAVLEFDLMAGSILKKRNLELTQPELQARTAQILRRGELSDAEYSRFIKDVQLAYDKKTSGGHPATVPTPPPVTPPPPDADQKLRDALRKTMEETKP